MKAIINFRNFQHLKTKNNEIIQQDKIFRSAAPEYGTADDFSKLHELKLDTIIDFREEDEKQKSLEKAFNDQFTRVSASINVANFFNHDEIKKIGLNCTNIDVYYNNIYKKLPTHFNHQYQILTHSLNKGDTMLFHCSAGKDRTGFAAYLTLNALGVHHDDIMADYLRSNEAALTFYESRKQESSDLQLDTLSLDVIQRLFGVQEEYLCTAMATIKDTYKTCEAYLTQELFADIDAIRQNYLE